MASSTDTERSANFDQAAIPAVSTLSANEFAFDFLKCLAAELSEGIVDLPGFPAVFARVCRALDDPNNTADKTAQIIGADPALAARVLTMANSVAFTQTGKHVADLRTAIARLGTQIVRGATSAFALGQVRQQASLKSIDQSLQALWDSSTHVAALAYVVAKNVKINADEAFLTGLLHGIGKLYILARAASSPALAARLPVIHDIIGAWHVGIGKAILENWDFPEPIINAVSDQDDAERIHYGKGDLTDVLLCAKILESASLEPDEQTVLIAATPAFARLGLDVDRSVLMLKHAELQIGAMRSALGD